MVTTTTLLLFVVLLKKIQSPHHVVHSLAITSSPTMTTAQSKNNNNNIIRGANKYGISNNSTILGPADAALKVGVKPTKEATKKEWQMAWKLHRYMMKPLHMWDGCRPKDSKLALACLWWKAIAGNDKSSPVYDYSLSYDLLPPVTRWIVSKRLCRFYPRLHHANVEIRTAYLDKALTSIINTIMNDHNTATITATTTQTQQIKKKKIRLIVMGGGYDTRSIKLLEHSLLRQSNDNDNVTIAQYNLLQKRHDDQSRKRKIRWYNRLLQRNNNNNRNNTSNSDHDKSGSNAFFNITSTNFDIEAYELDLPVVVSAKRKLLSSRLFRRRPWLLQSRKKLIMGNDDDDEEEYPKLVEANFNDLNATRNVLEGILLNENNQNDESESDEVTTVILFEGVMIYLDEGIPHALLGLCSDVLRKSRQHCCNSTNINDSPPTTLGYLCFADRLENIPGGDEDAAHVEMKSTGWELIDFLSKPGLARHMGVARVVE